MREKLIDFVKREYPQALPKVRAELHQLEDSSDFGSNGGEKGDRD